MLFPGGHSSSSVNPTCFNSQKAHDSQPLCGWIKVSQCLLILWVAKKVWVLQSASTEATWITAPEVSGKAVNINDSYHPPPGLLQPSSLHFSSSALFKGKESCSEQERQYCWQESFFSSLPLSLSLIFGRREITLNYMYRGFKAFKSIAPLSSDHKLSSQACVMQQSEGYFASFWSLSVAPCHVLQSGDSHHIHVTTADEFQAHIKIYQQLCRHKTFIPFFSSHFFCFAIQEIAVLVLAKKESFLLVICVAETASNHR